jgi:hypothetical protein
LNKLFFWYVRLRLSVGGVSFRHRSCAAGHGPGIRVVTIVYLKKYVLMKSLCSLFTGTKKMHKGICMAWLGKEKKKRRGRKKREKGERVRWRKRMLACMEHGICSHAMYNLAV